MTPPTVRHGITAAILLLLGACATGRPAVRPLTPAQLAAQDGGIPPYTKADVAFMQGMIGHHAQAVTMSAFAVANGAIGTIDVIVAFEAVAAIVVTVVMGASYSTTANGRGP